MNRINNIIDKFDTLIANKHTTAIKQFKALFGLEVLTDHRDFASAIVDPIGNPGNYLSNTWQELNWNSSYGSRDFFYFCGNVSNIDAPKEISEVDYALSNYTKGEPWVGLGGYAVSIMFSFFSVILECQALSASLTVSNDRTTSRSTPCLSVNRVNIIVMTAG